MAIQDYCIGLKGAVNAIHRVTRALSGSVNSTTISDAVEEVAIAIENGGGGGGGGTTDHTKLQNRDSADQHPIGAITGLETELNEKADASITYTKSEVDSSLATKQEKLQSGTNIKTINNTSLLGSGNIDIQGGDGGVFIAKHGVTSYADVAQAINDGKVVLIDLYNDGTILFPMRQGLTAQRAWFSGIGHVDTGEVWGSVTVNSDDTWSAFGYSSGDVYATFQLVYDTLSAYTEKTYVDAADNNLQSQLGTLSSLTTTEKSNLVGAINEVNAKSGGIDFEVGVEKPYGTYKDGNTTYPVYSKVIYISALPSASGITNYPHGVTNIKQVLAMYGICTNGIVMNTPRQTTSDNIGIYQVQKSGNFAIEVGKDRSSIGAYVTMIYAKDN